MKKLTALLVFTFLFSLTGLCQLEMDSMDVLIESGDDFSQASIDFAKGEATNGEEYFFGVLSAVIGIDVKFNAITVLDEIDAHPDEFITYLDTIIVLIEDCKAAMKLYEGKGWNNQEKLQALTIEWVDAVKTLVVDHLYGLVVPFSTPDEDWKKADTKLYDNYILALEYYYEVDTRWVDFQYEFAAANGFELSTETIDVDALIEEEMEKD